MVNTGYIALHRSLLNWEWYNDINTKCLFLHLLLLANHKKKRWRGKIIKRGQLITNLRDLGDQVGLTFQQTRTALSKLESTHEITRKATNEYTLIEIVNYRLYQDPDLKNNTRNNTQDNKRTTNEQQTNNKRITHTNNVNNVNNPPTPQGGGPKIFKGGLSELERLLGNSTWEETKGMAKKFKCDFGYLCSEYIQRIKKDGVPDDISKAFPKWRKKYIENYIKEQQPCLF